MIHSFQIRLLAMPSVRGRRIGQHDVDHNIVEHYRRQDQRYSPRGEMVASISKNRGFPREFPCSKTCQGQMGWVLHVKLVVIGLHVAMQNAFRLSVGIHSELAMQPFMACDFFTLVPLLTRPDDQQDLSLVT